MVQIPLLPDATLPLNGADLTLITQDGILKKVAKEQLVRDPVVDDAAVAVAAIQDEVNIVAANSDNITAVANDLTNIDLVAADLANIDLCAEDLPAIDAAPTYAADAAASASIAAANAAGLKGTSTTSVTIGTGAQSFSTQTGKQFNPGQFLLIASNANSANYMFGQVTSYSSTTLVLNVTVTGGSGTFADWNIAVSGTQGPPGPGGVTTISVATANGFSGSVANPTTTPVVTLSTTRTGILIGAAGSIGVATSGTDYSLGTSALSTGILKTTTGTGALTTAIAADFPTLNQDTTGTSASTGALNPGANINGVLFTGASNVTVPAAAGTLTGGTLASGVTQSSLTKVGTITSGIWNGTVVDEAHGGTNHSTYVAGDLLYATGANSLGVLPIGTAGQAITVSGGLPVWSTLSGTGTVSNVSIVSANGISGSVANPTTAPAITLTLGAITPASVNALTLAAQAVGFTIAGGTSSKTLTVNKSLTLDGADGVTLTAPTSTNILVISGTAKLTVSASQPVSPSVGDIWINTA